MAPPLQNTFGKSLFWQQEINEFFPDDNMQGVYVFIPASSREAKISGLLAAGKIL